MQYKVWIQVEEIDEDTDHYLTLDSSFGSTGEFDTEEEAQEFASRLHDMGEAAA